MFAGTERHAGIELERHAVVRRRLFNPAGQHIESLANLERFIVGFPVVFPVRVVHAVDHHGERPRVVAKIGFAKLRDAVLNVLHDGLTLRYVRDIRLDAGFVHADLVRVRIVPVDHALVEKRHCALVTFLDAHLIESRV